MREQLLAWLETLKEPAVYPLMRDLLRSMGYRKVTITHGTLEFGRDLVFLEVDKLGREIWRGIQVKATKLSASKASTESAREIIHQCEEALETAYTTTTGERVRLREIWLVTTKPLPEQTKLAIAGRLKERHLVHILDGADVADLLDKYLPDLLKRKSEPVDQYLLALIRFCDSIEQYIELRFKAKFNLKDIYIPARARITLVLPGCMEGIPSPADQLRLEYLQSNLALLGLLHCTACYLRHNGWPQQQS